MGEVGEGEHFWGGWGWIFWDIECYASVTLYAWRGKVSWLDGGYCVLRTLVGIAARSVVQLWTTQIIGPFLLFAMGKSRFLGFAKF